MTDYSYPYNLDLMTFGVVNGWAQTAAQKIKETIDNQILENILNQSVAALATETRSNNNVND